MKIFSFKVHSAVALAMAYGLLDLAPLLFGGCQRSSDIVGRYARTADGVKETLVLRQDGISEQDIVYKSGKRFTMTGTWSLHGSDVLTFRQFYGSFEGYTGKDREPPLLLTETTFILKGRLLVGDYEAGYYFRKEGESAMK